MYFGRILAETTCCGAFKVCQIQAQVQVFLLIYANVLFASTVCSKTGNVGTCRKALATPKSESEPSPIPAVEVAEIVLAEPEGDSVGVNVCFPVHAFLKSYFF